MAKLKMSRIHLLPHGLYKNSEVYRLIIKIDEYDGLWFISYDNIFGETLISSEHRGDIEEAMDDILKKVMDEYEYNMISYQREEKYILVEWPDIQILMEDEDFNRCYSLDFGAYMCPEDIVYKLKRQGKI